MSELLEGYKFYKSIQGTRYAQGRDDIRIPLSNFRKLLGDFTDKIFVKNNKFISPRNNKGNWLKTNGTTISEYMWNRYKPQDDNSTLVIYFNASTRKNEGLFISIGLIDDKLTEFEKEHQEEIYNFLEEGCKKISSNGFTRKNTGWGERVFSIIEEQKFESLDYNDLLQKLKSLYEETYKKFYNNVNEMPTHDKSIQPLNQILYGPPGTGKTYNTINKALEIIDGIVPEDRGEAKAKFEEYKKTGQIEFITFHQSYGYEEFVEGIKAKTSDNGIEYKIESGIFKKLCEEANTNTISFEKKVEQYRRLLESEKIILKTATGVSFTLSKSDYGVSTQTNHSFSVNKLIEINEGKLSSNPDSTYGKFIVEDIHKRFSNNESKNHILIIDEINRGNISKIFGELITLIEPSKRIGADEEIRVKLPYSGDEFGVPQNLYIIGTMNMADRSIALMDTALRRRFDFSEMMPKPELLDFEIDGISLKSLLETINKRVEYLYDRDHTIGHAYFVDVKSKDALDNVMKNKIIPLLQEYFYDDWEKIQIVLGDHPEQKSDAANKFVVEEKQNEKDVLGFNHEDIEDEQYSYTINEEFSNEAYLKLCKSK